MKLDYYIVDEQGQFRRCSRSDVESLWQGNCRIGKINERLTDELQIVTVVRDEQLHPVMCFFSKLKLSDGQITDESKLELYEAITTRKKNRYDHPASQRQFEGWPKNWRTQLAVALDVPVSQLHRVALGGPLPLSDLWGMSVDKIVEYFETDQDL